MNKVIVNLEEKTYPIYITTNYSEFGKILGSRGIEKKVVVITDENVDKNQWKNFYEGISEYGIEVSKFVIKPGETNKNLDTVREIYEFLVTQGLDRKSSLVALGGGVVGDITGFVAATFLRGINFIQVPTTLLSQADSSVGGKTGVDFAGFKNIIGAFYQPKFVYMNVSSFKTLPEREMRAGLAEVVKHGIIADRDYFDYIDYNSGRIFKLDSDVLQYLAKQNCMIKSGVVEKDEKEEGLRAILNFGHTIGHAIETHSNFELLHGEAISIGMIGAFKIAIKLEMTDNEQLTQVKALFRKLGLPTFYDKMDTEKVLELMYHDKKVKNSKLYFILPRKIGEVVEIGIDDKVLIKDVLEQLKSAD